MNKPQLDNNSSQSLLEEIVQLAFEKKAQNLISLDLRGLSYLSDYFIIPKIHNNVRTNFLAYPIILNTKKFNRKDLQIFLENNNIQTRPIFSGNILRHPAFTYLINKKNKLNEFHNADYIMKNGILIGCHQALKNKDINYIHSKINQFITKFK